MSTKNSSRYIAACLLLLTTITLSARVTDLACPWRWHPETKNYIKKGLLIGTVLNEKPAPHIRYLCTTLQYYIALVEVMGWCPGQNPHDNNTKFESYLHNAAVITNLTRNAYGLWVHKGKFN